MLLKFDFCMRLYFYQWNLLVSKTISIFRLDLALLNFMNLKKETEGIQIFFGNCHKNLCFNHFLL